MCGVEVRLTVERTMGLPLQVLFLLVCCFSNISLILGRIVTLKTIFETGAETEIHSLTRGAILEEQEPSRKRAVTEQEPRREPSRNRVWNREHIFHETSVLEAGIYFLSACALILFLSVYLVSLRNVTIYIYGRNLSLRKINSMAESIHPEKSMPRTRLPVALNFLKKHLCKTGIIYIYFKDLIV